MSLGENIKSIRKRNKLTQSNLAKILGVGALAVKNWENDKHKPSLKHLKHMSEYFKVDMLSFEEGVKPKFAKGVKAQKAHGVFNGLLHLVWGMKEEATDPAMKDALAELEGSIRAIIAERFTKQ